MESNQRIFISYSHQDAAHCQAIAEALRNIGYDVWYDTRLQPGIAWMTEIERQLINSDIFMLLLTPDSWASDFVQEEVQLAFAQKKIIVPILLRETEVSGFVSNRQYINGIGLNPKALADIVVAALPATLAQNRAEVVFHPSGGKLFPKPQYPALILLILAGGALAYWRGALEAFGIILTGGIIATLAKNFTYRFNQGAPSRTNGMIAFIVGLLGRTGIFFAAALLIALLTHVPNSIGPALLIGSIIGVFTALTHMVLLLFSGTYRYFMRWEKTAQDWNVEPFFFTLAGLLGATIGWSLTGAFFGGLGGWIATFL